MNVWAFEYAQMRAVDIAAWIIIATLAGLVARQIVQGKPLAGLWSDMVIGLIGAFAVGTGMRLLDFDLSQVILEARPGIQSEFAIWVDIFVAAFVGALVLRIILRFAKQ
jgi:uncharacterized membrane protein YeaQ/YmgE (transglycosylase-associated protein family)